MSISTPKFDPQIVVSENTLLRSVIEYPGDESIVPAGRDYKYKFRLNFQVLTKHNPDFLTRSKLWAAVKEDYDRRGECTSSELTKHFEDEDYSTRTSELEAIKDISALPLTSQTRLYEGQVERYVENQKGMTSRILMSRVMGDLGRTNVNQTELLLKLTSDLGKIAEDRPWGKPLPLKTVAKLPPFPTDALPKVLQDWVLTHSGFNQFETSMLAPLGLVALATAAQRAFTVEVKPGFRVHLPIFACVIAESGERKSPAVDAAFDPIYEIMKANQEASGDIVRGHRLDVEQLESRLAAAKKNEPKAGDECGRQAVLALDKELEYLKQHAPILPEYVVQDVTSEKLGVKLAEQRESIALLDTEGVGPINNMLGRYAGGKIDCTLYLKGWSGEHHTVDRISRDKIFLECARISMGIVTQHTVLQTVAKTPELRGLGLLGRFLWAMPDERFGTQLVANSKPLDPSAVQAYHELLEKLFAHEAVRKQGLRAIKLSSAAASAWSAFNDQEVQLKAKDYRSIREWSAKSAGQLARIAALLHCCYHPENPDQHEVSLDIMERAIRIIIWFRTQAVRVLAVELEVEGDGIYQTAQRVLTFLKHRDLKEISRRDLYQGVKNKVSIRTTEDLEAPLRLLQDLGYVRVIQASKELNKGGRAPGPRILINPISLDADPQDIEAELATLSDAELQEQTCH